MSANKNTRETVVLDGKTYVRNDSPVDGIECIRHGEKIYTLETPEETTAAERAIRDSWKITTRSTTYGFENPEEAEAAAEFLRNQPMHRLGSAYDIDPLNNKRFIDLDSQGELPEPSNQAPYGFEKLFDVKLSRIPGWGGVIFFAALLLVFFPAVTQNPLEEFIRKPELGAFCVISIVAFFYLFKKISFAKSNPVLLEVYEHGFWLNWQKIFIPYERLQAVRVINHPTAHSRCVRTVRFQVFLKQADIRRIGKWWCFKPTASIEIILPGRDGLTTVPLDEIVQKISELSKKNNEARSFPVPDSSIDPWMV